VPFYVLATRWEAAMGHKAYYSETLDRPAPMVWDVVRDFNSYPVWINEIEDSHIEDDLSGTAVGAVRNFAIGGSRTRQRLVAHSDAERFFTYESCAALEIEVSGTARTLWRYQGTCGCGRSSRATAASWSGRLSTTARTRTPSIGPSGGRRCCRRGWAPCAWDVPSRD
jgi:hypothetical protein